MCATKYVRKSSSMRKLTHEKGSVCEKERVIESEITREREILTRVMRNST